MFHLKKLSQQRSLNFQTLLKRRRNLLCWLDVGSSNRRGVFIGGVPMNSQFIRLMFVPMVLALVGLVASDSYADKATIELWNGTYTGDVSNGVPHGQGVFIHPDDHLYVGSWKNGVAHGQGTQRYSGLLFAGEYEDGNRNGQGTFIYTKGRSKGDKYIGGVTNNTPDGRGAYIFQDGGKFVGEVKAGKFWNGINYLANGTVNGTYSAGKECDKCKPKQSQRALVAEVTAGLKKLNSGSRIVWCATKIYAFETTELFCRENDGKKYSTKALADTEHKRLKATPSTSSSSNSDAALELEYWNVVKKSNDVDLLQAYLDEYPNGKFAPLAKIKIKKLK